MAIPKTKKEKYKDYFTYAQYKTWSDDERWELIEGEAYNMSPAPGTTHQTVSGEVFSIIHNYLEDKPCRVFAAPFDIFLPDEDEPEDEINTIVQPDIVVLCDDEKLSEKGITGPPDIVIEILSPSSMTRDQITKRDLYEKKGIKEYWIFDPAGKIVWKYVLINGEYGKPDVFDYKSTHSFKVLPELSLNLTKVFGMENYKEEADEKKPGYSKNSKENRL